MTKEIKTVADLSPDSHNANAGTPRGQKMIEASIQEDGFGRPVLVDKNGKLIAGNKTIQSVADAFGIDTEVILVKTDGKKVIVHQREDLDLDDLKGSARRLAYRDNLTSHFSFEMEPAVVLADFEAGFDFDAIGLEVGDLAELLPDVDFGQNGDGGKDTEPQIDKAEELRQKWGVEIGQMWQLGEHRLICGDCTDAAVVERVMGGEKADIEIHDPPYGMNLDTDYSKMPSAKKGGNKGYKPVKGDNVDFDPSHLLSSSANELFLWGADYYCELIPNKNEGTWLIWDKRVEDKFDEMIGSAFELVWSRVRHKRQIIRYNNTLFSGNSEAKNKLHPTQKPTAVYEWLLNKYSKEGDISADFYLGAGSHLLACHNLNRKARAIEIDPGYVAVTLQRFKDHTGVNPILMD